MRITINSFKHGKWNLNIIVCERGKKKNLVIEKVGNVIGILKLKVLFLGVKHGKWKTCKRIDWEYFGHQNWEI